MKAVDKTLLTYSEAVKQSMITYEYSTSDINFVVNSLFASEYTEKINLEMVANICIRTYMLSNTGRYSFSFNSVLHRVIREKNVKNIFLLASMGEHEAFPELYDNKDLTSEEFATISTIIQRERLSSVNALEMAISSHEEFILIFGKRTLYKEVESLYSKAYQYVYSQEMLGDISPILAHVPDKVYIMGESYFSKELQIEEVEYMTFIWKLVDNDNQFRKIKIKEEILEFMKKQKSTETKLCSYWLHNKV